MTTSTTFVQADEKVGRRSGQIRLHGPEDFAAMRKAGALTAEALDLIGPLVKPGVTTASLDRFVFEFASDHDAYPAPLNYRGYRKSICTSINHVVCHGIPDDKPLRDGDILNIDVTLIVDGWHGDASRMFVAGEAPRRAQRLIDVTYEAMMRGIEAVKPGGTTGDIGSAIQTYAEAERCSVVRDFCGHGLGRLFHDEPNILHFGRKGEGVPLRPGMFFTIEPMINLGGYGVKILSDGWTAVTRDRSLSAQFEHTVGVTETGSRFSPFRHGGRPRADPMTSEAGRDAKAYHGRRGGRRIQLHEAGAPAPAAGDRSRPPTSPEGGEGEAAALSRPSRAAVAPPGSRAGALADYELLELVLFRAIPRRDVKPLAKALVARFGSFAEAIAADRDGWPRSRA